MPESPRDIYAAACSSIAAPFAEQGYRFAKSGPHASCKSGEFTYQIAFQSSHKNVAGAVVRMWVQGTVYSKRLEKWRESYPEITNTDYVAGGQIGNLLDEPTTSEWNLADPTTRQETIANVTSTIELVAIPYFARFGEIDTLTSTLTTRDIPSMTIDRVIEFLVCFADAETARMAAVNYLRRRPDLVRAYARDYARYAERGLGWSHASGFAKQLALASHLFHFGNLTLDDE